MSDTRTRTDDDPDEQRHDEHLDNVEDGCGCTEVWEHLSEERDDD